MIINEKQLMANCLDALQEAEESIEDIIDHDPDHEAAEWYDDIQQIYGTVLKRYES